MFVATACQSPAEQNATAPLPDWVAKLIATQEARIIEEETYQGRRVFHVMPSDRADDVGNEHVLYSQDGQIICEFGGYVGHVTVGACDIDQIKFVRTIFAKR